MTVHTNDESSTGKLPTSVRRAITLILVLLTSLSTVTTSVSIWTHQVVFDTDRFMTTIEPVLNEPDVYVLIGDQVTDSVLEILAVEERLTDQLSDLDTYVSEALTAALPPDSRLEDLAERLDPPSFSQLASPIAGAVEGRISDGIHGFISVDNFGEPLTRLLRRAHEVAISLVRADLTEYPNVYIKEGEVTLDVTPFIGQALSSIAGDVRAVLPDFDPPAFVADQVVEARDQLGSSLETRLPDDFGQISVMSANVLSQAQASAAQLDRLAWVSLVLTVILLTATFVVSPFRWRTAIHLGIGVVLAVVATAMILGWLESSIVDAISDPQGSAVAGSLVREVLSGLRALELLLAGVAIVLAVVAYLSGRPTRDGTP